MSKKPDRPAPDWTKRLLDEVQRIRHEHGEHSEEEAGFLARIGLARYVRKEENPDNPFHHLDKKTEHTLLWELGASIFEIVKKDEDISPYGDGAAGWMRHLKYTPDLDEGATRQTQVISDLAVVMRRDNDEWNDKLKRQDRVDVLDFIARGAEAINNTKTTFAENGVANYGDRIVVDKHTYDYGFYQPDGSASSRRTAAAVCPQTKQIAYGLYGSSDETKNYGMAVMLLSHEMAHRLSMKSRAAEYAANSEAGEQPGTNAFLYQTCLALYGNFKSNAQMFTSEEAYLQANNMYLQQPEELLARNAQMKEKDIYALSKRIIPNDVLEEYKQRMQDDPSLALVVDAITVYQQKHHTPKTILSSSLQV